MDRASAATLTTPKLTRPIVRSGMTPDDFLARYVNVAIVVQPTAVPRIVSNECQ